MNAAAASLGFSSVMAPLVRRVRSRLFLIDWLRRLQHLAWLPWLALPVIVGLRLAGGPAWEVPVAAAAVALWVVLPAALAWHHRTAPYRALADWDAAGGRADALSSAYHFAREPATGPDPGRELHLDRSRALALEASGRLADDLPLPRFGWRWAGAVVPLVFALTPWLKPGVAAGDRPLTAEMVAAARTEAGKLTQPDPAAMHGLTDEERRRLEEMQKDLDKLAAELRQADGRTPREILDDLENQAKAAETLAAELGLDPNAWASEEMIRELRRHPDTADLAEAVADKHAGRAATASRILASQLKNPAITSEAASRMGEALDRTMQQAGEPDRTKIVGQHVGEADRHMKLHQPPAAGTDFENLADRFARIEQRENAREQLNDLAKRLRESGSSIVGQKGEPMKKLDGSRAAESSPMPEMARLGQPSDQSGAGQQLPVPGLGQSKPQPGRSRGTPIPGTGAPSKNAKPLAVVPGSEAKDAKPLVLAAPIPGTAPGKVAIAVPGGQPGAGPPASGTLPGRGHIESTGDPGKLAAAAAQGEVAAPINDDGESFVQEIEGEPHEESARRAAKETAATFLKTQEEAFDEKSLPPSRREQVRRYFEALRTRYAE